MHTLIRSFWLGLIFLLGMVFVSDAWALSPQTNPGPFPPDISIIKKRGVLIAAINNGNIPPFYARDAKGNWSGIDIDLANMIAQQLNVKLQIIPMDNYDDVVNTVAADKADIGIGLLSITPQRALRVRFTNAYYKFHPHLLINRLQLQTLGWSAWDVVDQMEGAKAPIKLGALADSADVDLLEEAFPSAQVVGYPSISDTLQAVTDGKVFAAVGDAPQQVHNWLVQHPDASIKAADVTILNKTVLIGIAVSWQDESFRQWLNVYLNYITMNNIINELFEKYGEQDQES